MQPLKVLTALPTSAELGDLGLCIRDSGLTADVTPFEDPMAALDALLENDFDCAFLSAGTPAFDRVNILSELRRAGNSVPVVFILAEESDAKVADYLLAGAHDCMTLASITPKSSPVP